MPKCLIHKDEMIFFLTRDCSLTEKKKQDMLCPSNIEK